jgi:diguanylate cyclase (GGDEF)-like protein
MMGPVERNAPEGTLLGPSAAALARLIALPPLGQVGPHRYAALLRPAVDLFGADAASLGFWVSPHEMRRVRVLTGEVAREVHEDVVDPGSADGPLRRALRQGSVVSYRSGEDAALDPLVDGVPGHAVRSALYVGLRMRDEPPAVLAVYRFRDLPFDAGLQKLAEEGAPVFSAAVDNLRRFARAEELSITDGLTGVYNYRYLRSALDQEVARARRFREEFSVIMLDVDHLKEYNDVHGHLHGSEVLRRLASVVLGELRATDMLAKYGGDEFVIILPQTRREGARVLAERIRAAVSSHAFPGEEHGRKITTSMGIAQFPDDGELARDLLEAADRALYDAKRTGRNRVAAVMPGPGTS